MFVPEEYKNYKYLVSVSDNYVVLSDTHNVNADWTNPRDIDVIYQYNYPSILTIEGTRTVTSSQSYPLVNISSDFYDRADCPLIFVCIFIAIFFCCFIINALTRFVKRGGIFFGE